MKITLLKHLRNKPDALDKLIVGWNLEEIRKAFMSNPNRKKIYDEGFMAGRRFADKKLKEFEKRFRKIEKELQLREVNERGTNNE